MSIIEIFWANVDWHIEKKGLHLSKTLEVARKKRAWITLRNVEQVAKYLKIDDYAILFEEVPEI